MPICPFLSNKSRVAIAISNSNIFNVLSSVSSAINLFPIDILLHNSFKHAMQM